MKDPVMEMEIPKAVADPALPWMKWIEYKGETYFATVNLEKSLSAHRPIVDLSYCATKGLNNTVLHSVNWNPEHFKPSKLE